MSQHSQLRKRSFHRLVNRDLNANMPRYLLPRFSPTAIFTDSPDDGALPTATPVADPAPIHRPANNPPPPPANPTPPTQSTPPTPNPPLEHPVTPSLTPETSAVAPTTLQIPLAQSSSTSVSLSSAAPTTSIVPTSLPPTSTPAAQIPAKSPPPVTPVQSTPVVTQTFFHSVGGASASNQFGLASASASPSASAAPSGSSTGVIIGGVVAAIIGAIGLTVGLVYFLRKCRKQNEEEDAVVWNAGDARRQSSMLGDEPTFPPPMMRAATVHRGDGNSPRPPTMIERKLNNSPGMLQRQPTYGTTQYDNSGYGYQYGAEYGATGQSNFGSFVPGEYVTSPGMSPVTATSANPFVSPYAQDTLPSPGYDTSGFGDVAYPQTAVTRQPSQPYISRQNSLQGASFSSPITPVTPAHPDMDDETHYVDLSRSSVSPYQAAQYAEISRKLGTPVPVPVPALHSVDEEPLPIPAGLGAGNPHAQAADGRAQSVSPFTDPGSYGHARMKSNPGDPVTDADMDNDAQELDFPHPPTGTGNVRGYSGPPVLPEITVQERGFSPVSYNFPIPQSATDSPSPFRTEFGDMSAGTGAVPKSPSPLAGAPIQAVVQPRPAKVQQQEKRPMSTATTVYDPEDAYDGI